MLQGVITSTQQCYYKSTPTSFIWCQTDGAEMPWTNRTKGRAIWGAQKCQHPHTLPIQFNGVIVKTQKCQDIVAPRERSTNLRRNAEERPPLPTSLTGAVMTMQQCQNPNAPREGSPLGRRNAIRAMPFPPVTGGQRLSAEMPVPILPPPNLGHQTPAEMPRM
jgi:hypothetical protein